MAEIITRSKAGRRTVHNTKVDLTPMVDLGFLLITFFVFTTTMSSNTGMNLVMPKDDQVGMPIAQSGAVTIIPSERNIWYYEGEMPNNKINMTAIAYNDITTLRTKLLSLSRRLIQANGNNNKMMVMIKPTSTSSFNQVVDMLDEMTICGVTRYALLDVSEAEKNMIAER